MIYIMSLHKDGFYLLMVEFRCSLWTQLVSIMGEFLSHYGFRFAEGVS
jgi:hypothetical protein